MINRAAAKLAEILLESGLSRIAFLGLAKNVGKTTALVSVLEEFARNGIVAGATSAGRDGEDFDAITGEPKPRFRLWPGQLAASASSTFASIPLRSTLLDALPFETRFGAIEIRRIEEEGEIEMIGPSTASQMAQTCRRLAAHGSRIVLLDGALGRRAFASARVADGIVLSVGLSAGSAAPAALEAARRAADLLSLRVPAPSKLLRKIDGALTDSLLENEPPGEGETLLVDDFASIFLSSESRRALEEKRVVLAVRRAVRLLAATANPTGPGRAPAEPKAFLEALSAALPGTPVFDLVAGLSKTAGL